MTATFLGPEVPLQERFDELDRLTREFCVDLIQLWVHAGKPSMQRMAEIAQVPRGTLEIFFQDRAMPLPSRHEVQGILDGTATPQSAQHRWLERHARLTARRGELARERSTDSRREAAQRTEGTQRPRSVEVSGPLTTALKAHTMKDLQTALRNLRVGSGLSLERLAKASRGAFSGSTAHRIETDDRAPSREQVVAFVTACGQTESEVGLWVRAWEKLHVGCVSAPGDGTRGAGHPERVEIISHPVTYLLGGEVDENVVNELRLRITPKIELVAGAAMVLGLATVLTAGAAVAARFTNSRVPLYAALAGGVTGAASAVLRHRFDTLDDRALLELAGADTMRKKARAMLTVLRNPPRRP